MIKTAQDVFHWLDSRLKFGIKPGLERMEWLMEKLDHPERFVKAIHIGGTNGKGSTTAFLRSILQEAKYEVGTFTSPGFESMNEQIAVNGQPISDKDLIYCANQIKPFVDQLDEENNPPTEFEIMTTIALMFFAKVHPVDLVLFEVGLGGRFDSTNVIHPLLSIITNIGYDHIDILGSSLEEIAEEKAGIIKNGVPVITAIKNTAALDVIRQKGKEKKATVYILGKQFSYTDLGPTTNGEKFSLQMISKNFPELNINMMGVHQIENASLAVMAANYLKTYYSLLIEDEHVVKGLEKAFWQGRFQMISKRPLIIFDGAHNPEGIESLKLTLERHYPNKKKRIVFAALKDKQLHKMIPILDQMPARLIFTEFSHPRAANAEDLFALSNAENKEIQKDFEGYLQEAVKHLTDEEMLILTGSLYFISQCKLKFTKMLKLEK